MSSSSGFVLTVQSSHIYLYVLFLLPAVSPRTLLRRHSSHDSLLTSHRSSSKQRKLDDYNRVTLPVTGRPMLTNSNISTSSNTEAASTSAAKLSMAAALDKGGSSMEDPIEQKRQDALRLRQHRSKLRIVSVTISVVWCRARACRISVVRCCACV